MDIPLDGDFDATLEFVKTLRRMVREDPIVPNSNGGIQTNPAYVLLKDQELHLRGLARIMGPANVEQEIMKEFKASRLLVTELMEKVVDAPIADGERHVQTRNPIAVILGCEQTHMRGCAALLQSAKAVVSVDGADEFEALFDEPAAVAR